MAFGDQASIPRKDPSSTDHYVDGIEVSAGPPKVHREVVEQGGSDTVASGKVTLSTGASTSIVASRARRRSLTIRNDDGANAIHIATGTATTADWMLPPKSSQTFINYSGAINAIRAGGTPDVWYLEEYETA